MIPLTLASTSPFRIKLLKDAGILVSPAAPPVDEAAITAPTAVGTAEARALGKALAVLRVHQPDGVVIGADQVVHIDGALFHKPTSPRDHREMLGRLRGRTHAVSTAVALARADAEPVVFVEHTYVTMRADLTDDDIAAYVRTGEGAACAGGYEMEHQGILLMERIEGDWSNIIGLPILPLVHQLRRLGWAPPALSPR